ncbi:MAG TPA: response regulator [Gemmatimonadaceae bacterium]|nr:response regulator [Gemmatimonadaceae bacterium]
MPFSAIASSTRFRLSPPGEGPSDSRHQTAAQGSPAHKRVEQRAPHVLVIDDEASIRAALRRFFVRRGWGYDEAGDGAHGLELLLGAKEPYTVVVCDIRMPRMTGAELYDALVSQRPDLLPRLIFIAGDVTSPDVVSFLSRIDRPVLMKPFELQMLAQTIERLRKEIGDG